MITEYLQRAGSFVMGAVRESVNNHESETVNAQVDHDIALTTSALYEAKVDDDMIIRLLQKYWNITEKDAYECLRVEKTIQHPCCAIAEYLMKHEAMTQEEADDIIINQGIIDYLRNDRNAWKLTPNELLEKAGLHY